MALVEEHPAVMSMYELEISWATSAVERRYLGRELLACDEVRGVFLTARDDVLAVLFAGGPRAFHDWAHGLTAQANNEKGAWQ